MLDYNTLQFKYDCLQHRHKKLLKEVDRLMTIVIDQHKQIKALQSKYHNAICTQSYEDLTK